MDTESCDDMENKAECVNDETISLTAPSPIDNEEESSVQQREVAEEGKDLEDIESDEDADDLLENTNETNIPKLVTPRTKTCQSCRLMFTDEDAFKIHEKSEHHEMASFGFKPSTGKSYCFLCWLGFKDATLLFEHYGSATHEGNVAEARVKAICPDSIGVGVPEPSHNDDMPGPAKRIRISRFNEVEPEERFYQQADVRNRMSSNVPSGLGTVKKIDRAEWICEDCNVVFSRYFDAREHARSPNHLSVLVGCYPAARSGVAPTQSVSRLTGQMNFCCFICWYGFTDVKELDKHCASTWHRHQLKRSGVVMMYRNIQSKPPKGSHSTREMRGNKHAYLESAEDFIVVDEVKGSDEDEESRQLCHNHKSGCSSMEPILGAEADVLDEVSSDEEVISRPVAQTSGTALQDLEDVDSEEDDRLLQPQAVCTPAKDKIVFEDVDSSEDDMDVLCPVTENTVPAAPPPPKISLVDEPVKQYASSRLKPHAH